MGNGWSSGYNSVTRWFVLRVWFHDPEDAMLEPPTVPGTIVVSAQDIRGFEFTTTDEEEIAVVILKQPPEADRRLLLRNTTQDDVLALLKGESDASGT
jgi:hypothetical protein